MDRQPGRFIGGDRRVNGENRTVIFEDLVELSPTGSARLPSTKQFRGDKQPSLPKNKPAKFAKLRNFSLGKFVDRIPSFLH